MSYDRSNFSHIDYIIYLHYYYSSLHYLFIYYIDVLLISIRMLFKNELM